MCTLYAGCVKEWTTVKKFNEEIYKACLNILNIFDRKTVIFLIYLSAFSTELYNTLERVLNLFLLDHSVREKADVI